MEDQLNKILEYLKRKGVDAESNKTNVISFYVVISGQRYVAECVLGNGFPYVLPEIYASDSLFEIIYSIPHVSHWKNICTFDRTTTVPNFESPEEMVFACISKAIQIINEGLAKVNDDDYIDEAQSYWTNIPHSKTFYLLGEEKEYKKTAWFIDDCIFPSKERCGDKAKQALILKTNFIFKGNYSFTDFVYNCLDIKAREELLNYLDTDIKKTRFIIFKNSIKGKTTYLGMFTPSYCETINGFRVGKVNISIAMNFFKNKVFEPVSIMNATHENLYNRGGAGITRKADSVCVVGCGSFGGYLSELLMDYGIKKFLLIDNETLSSDNIARHYCDFKYRETEKAKALAFSLRTHNPNLVCEHIDDDIHKVLSSKPEQLNNYDYVFVCVGDLGTEKRFFDLVKNKIVTKPVILVWAEPFCLACHAIVLNNNSEAFHVVYNSNFEFLHSVVKNADSFYKRDAGCRSTYVPYSSYMIKHFLIDFLFELFDGKKLETNNYSYIWLGNLESSKEINAIIADEFASCSRFSSIIRKIT